MSSSSDASTYFQTETPSHISIVLNLIAGDKRSPSPILGQRHSFNCIARFFPNLSTFLECPCGRNIVGQQLPTLLDVTCCVRLHTLLHVVACCCAKFEPVKLFSQQLPTFLLFRDPRSVAQQCWIRLHSLLGPRTLITHGLQRLMGCIPPTMHCRSQHCWRNNVGSCCSRLHTA